MWIEQVDRISKMKEERNRKLNLPANEDELIFFGD